MSHVFREDAPVGSLVSRCFAFAFGPLVRDGRYHFGLALFGGSALMIWRSSPCLAYKTRATSLSAILRV